MITTFCKYFRGYPYVAFSTKNNLQNEYHEQLRQIHDEKMKKLKEYLNSEDTSASVMLPDANTKIFSKLDRDFVDAKKNFKKREKELNKQLEEQYKREYQQKEAFEINIPEPTIKNDPSAKSTAEKKVSLINLPKRLQVRCLRNRINSNQLFLVGVSRGDFAHTTYIHELIQSLRPQMVTTQIPCDLPYFIRTEQNYADAWKNFILGTHDAKFYISPEPNSLESIMFNQLKIQSFVDNTIKKSNEFEINPIAITEERGPLKICDTLKTPFVYIYNNPGRKLPLIISGHPELKYRHRVARSVKLELLWDLYQQKLSAIDAKKGADFDPLLLAPKDLVLPKIDYETEVLKQCNYTYKIVVSLVDNNSIDQLEESWQKMKTSDPQSFSNLINPQGKFQEQSIEEYLKKLILIDKLTYPLIQNSFVKFKYVPNLNKYDFKPNLEKGMVAEQQLAYLWQDLQYKIEKNNKID